MSVILSVVPGLLRPILKPTRGRPRLPTPERLERRKATQKAWVGRNYDYVTAQCKRLATRPEYQERRREIYSGKRQRLLESGVVPRPRGRPRLYETEEALREHNRIRRQELRMELLALGGAFTEACSAELKSQVV
jgi:hypothetical protein